MAGLPTCPSCAERFRHYPFPPWIKMAMAGLAVLVVFSFISNYRYFAGYVETRKAMAVMRNGELERAQILMASAVRRVPESAELGALHSFCSALILMKEDKPAEALPLLRTCKNFFQDPQFDPLILQAEAGAAFDAGEYDTFLAKEELLYKQTPDVPYAMAGLASAYACKYAKTGREDYKQKSLDLLKQAKEKSPPGDAEYAEYRMRIMYRLTSKEIVSRKEFYKRFPKGWMEGDRP